MKIKILDLEDWKVRCSYSEQLKSFENELLILLGISHSISDMDIKGHMITFHSLNNWVKFIIWLSKKLIKLLVRVVLFYVI